VLRYQYEGTTDEVTSCDCCGRANLKSTVVLTDLDEGIERFFGVVCAAKMLKVTSAEVRANAKRATTRNKQRLGRNSKQSQTKEAAAG